MDYQAVSDPELARLTRENDPDAFRELAARYLWLIRSKARLFQGPSVPEEEDLVQEGFLGLYSAAVTFSEEDGASFSTYAGVCVYNRMLSAARKHRSEKNRPLNEFLSLDSAAERIPAESGPEDLLEVRDQFQRLLRRMDRVLTPLERKALSLYLGGCKRSQVPARSGMSLKTFDNALYRVRDKLKNLEYLKKSEDDDDV